jgi:hypothetical protein
MKLAGTKAKTEPGYRLLFVRVRAFTRFISQDREVWSMLPWEMTIVAWGRVIVKVRTATSMMATTSFVGLICCGIFRQW